MVRENQAGGIVDSLLVRTVNACRHGIIDNDVGQSLTVGQRDADRARGLWIS